MIDLTYVAPQAWERGYLLEISDFIPEIRAIAVHWWSQRRLRRWWPKAISLPKPRLHVPKQVDRDTVVIIISDELYRAPKTISALAVFKQYVGETDATSIPFPLGFHTGFPNLPVQPIKERPIDIGFIGRSYPHRVEFLMRLKDHQKLRRCRIQFNCEGGMSISDYAKSLNDTKVSLCLPGYIGPETFRYYESVKLGCVVVTAKMPANPLYHTHPGFQVGNMDDVDAVATVLQSILDKPAEYDALQQRALAVWEQQYSPEAVSRMVREVVVLRASER